MKAILHSWLVLCFLTVSSLFAIPPVDCKVDLESHNIDADITYHPTGGIQLTGFVDGDPLLVQYDDSPFQQRWSSQLDAATPPYLLASSGLDRSADNRFSTHFIEPGIAGDLAAPVNFLSVNGNTGEIFYHVKIEPTGSLSEKNLVRFEDGPSGLVEVDGDNARVTLIDSDGTLLIDRLYTSPLPEDIPGEIVGRAAKLEKIPGGDFGYYLSRTFDVDLTDTDVRLTGIALMKLSPTGEIVWTRSFPSLFSVDFRDQSIALSHSGGYLYALPAVSLNASETAFDIGTNMIHFADDGTVTQQKFLKNLLVSDFPDIDSQGISLLSNSNKVLLSGLAPETGSFETTQPTAAVWDVATGAVESSLSLAPSDALAIRYEGENSSRYYFSSLKTTESSLGAFVFSTTKSLQVSRARQLSVWRNLPKLSVISDSQLLLSVQTGASILRVQTLGQHMEPEGDAKDLFYRKLLSPVAVPLNSDEDLTGEATTDPGTFQAGNTSLLGNLPSNVLSSPIFTTEKAEDGPLFSDFFIEDQPGLDEFVGGALFGGPQGTGYFFRALSLPTNPGGYPVQSLARYNEEAELIWSRYLDFPHDVVQEPVVEINALDLDTFFSGYFPTLGEGIPVQAEIQITDAKSGVAQLQKAITLPAGVDPAAVKLDFFPGQISTVLATQGNAIRLLALNSAGDATFSQSYAFDDFTPAPAQIQLLQLPDLSGFLLSAWDFDSSQPAIEVKLLWIDTNGAVTYSQSFTLPSVSSPTTLGTFGAPLIEVASDQSAFVVMPTFDLNGGESDSISFNTSLVKVSPSSGLAFSTELNGAMVKAAAFSQDNGSVLISLSEIPDVTIGSEDFEENFLNNSSLTSGVLDYSSGAISNGFSLSTSDITFGEVVGADDDYIYFTAVGVSAESLEEDEDSDIRAASFYIGATTLDSELVRLVKLNEPSFPLLSAKPSGEILLSLVNTVENSVSAYSLDFPLEESGVACELYRDFSGATFSAANLSSHSQTISSSDITLATPTSTGAFVISDSTAMNPVRSLKLCQERCSDETLPATINSSGSNLFEITLASVTGNRYILTCTESLQGGGLTSDAKNGFLLLYQPLFEAIATVVAEGEEVSFEDTRQGRNAFYVIRGIPNTK